MRAGRILGIATRPRQQWFDLYLQPVGELEERIHALPAVAEILLPTVDETPAVVSHRALELARAKSRDIAAIARELRAHAPLDTSSFDAIERDALLELLALFKALTAEVRARCHYGQGMAALLDAGRRGNDTGYLRAVAIDPHLQWHPHIAERIEREACMLHNDFARQLQRAAAQGPSKRIDREHHQLRYLLALLRERGLLRQLKDTDRYRLFRHELGLYSDSGKNPKAALCAFVKRWEANLL